MPAQHDDHAWEVLIAEGTLTRFGADAREDLVGRMETAVRSSFIENDDLGLSVSQYPGEDDGDEPPSRDTASYVIEHLLPHTFGTSADKGRGRNEGLLALSKELEPHEFVAVLLLYADRIGDTAAVRRAHDLIIKPTHPALELLHSYRRRLKGGYGRASALNKDLSPRDNAIRERAERLRASGRPEREIVGIITQLTSLTDGLGPRQIRRILKNTDTS